jgi:hypothetical protein
LLHKFRADSLPTSLLDISILLDHDPRRYPSRSRGHHGTVTSPKPRISSIFGENAASRGCVLLLQDLLQSYSRGAGRIVEDMCYERRQAGTHEEPGTLTQGAPVFPSSSRLGIPNSRVAGALARSNRQAERGSDPNYRGIWSGASVCLDFY